MILINRKRGGHINLIMDIHVYDVMSKFSDNKTIRNILVIFLKNASSLLLCGFIGIWNLCLKVHQKTLQNEMRNIKGLI